MQGFARIHKISFTDSHIGIPSYMLKSVVRVMNTDQHYIYLKCKTKDSPTLDSSRRASTSPVVPSNNVY